MPNKVTEKRLGDLINIQETRVSQTFYDPDFTNPVKIKNSDLYKTNFIDGQFIAYNYTDSFTKLPNLVFDTKYFFVQMTNGRNAGKTFLIERDVTSAFNRKKSSKKSLRKLVKKSKSPHKLVKKSKSPRKH
jgi:hypothetical protein